MTTLTATGFLVAFLILVIVILRERLKRAKEKAAENAAKAKLYEKQMGNIKKLQDEFSELDKEKAPDTVPVSTDDNERLERLNGMSKRNQ